MGNGYGLWMSAGNIKTTPNRVALHNYEFRAIEKWEVICQDNRHLIEVKATRNCLIWNVVDHVTTSSVQRDEYLESSEYKTLCFAEQEHYKSGKHFSGITNNWTDEVFNRQNNGVVEWTLRHCTILPDARAMNAKPAKPQIMTFLQHDVTRSNGLYEVTPQTGNTTVAKTTDKKNSRFTNMLRKHSLSEIAQ